MFKSLLVLNIYRIFISLGIILMLGQISFAGSGKYKNSKQPYWSIGQYNSALSDACRRHEFNQRKIQNLNIGYSGNNGRGVTGIATQEWNLYDPLKVNKYGMLEPNLSKKFVVPNIMLIPLLAYDLKNNRIGYGKGYYDRFLNKYLKIKKNMLTIGIAFSFQK